MPHARESIILNYTIENIKDFLARASVPKTINLDWDIFGVIGMGGDDFHEIMDNFASKFTVDMNEYLWYFHADEEGQNFVALFFTPPYQKFKNIPITPIMLLEFCE